MKKLRCRIICIITLVVVTFGSILNPALSLRSQATGVVEGGLLISLLIDLAVSCGILYVGHEAVESFDRDTLEDELLNYCYTAEGYNALLDIVIKEAGTKEEMQTVRDRFRAEYMSGGSNQSPDPKKVDEILKATVLSGVSAGTAFIFLKHFFANRTSSSSGSELGAAINEASNQTVYFVNPILPDNVYIGFNPDVIPGIAAMDGYDESLSHIQFHNPNLEGYAVGQIDFSEYNGGGRMFYNALNLRNYNGNYTVRSRVQYIIESDGSLSTFGYNNPAYVFTSSGSELYNDGFMYMYITIDELHPLYISPSAIQPVLYEYRENDHVYKYYLVYPSGAVSDGTTFTQPSGVSTAEEALTSVKPIVKMDISALVDAIGKAIVDAHPDEVPSLSPEAVAAILSGVAGVYDDAVTNYYNDTSYIDQSQYITNITNVYEQAIADYPVIDIPVTDAGILSGIKAIPGQIANVLKDIFVPDIALYTFYFSDIKSKFAFIDGISEFGTNLIDILFNSDPEIPKIIIDFGLAESKYNYGGRTYALDMTFYARFKPLVDNIIVSFSWLAFVYWFYKNLPEIISGTVLSRKDYAIVKETGNTLLHGDGTFSKTRVKEIRDIDKIVTDKPGKKK